jgi:hypothetical protein
VTAFVEKLSNMVAQAKPTGMGGGGPAGSVSAPTQPQPQMPSTGQQMLGGFSTGMATGIAEQMDFLHNPERVGERAQKTWEMIVDMPDELRQEILTQPQVQKQIEGYAKARPEMWFKDKALGGMWNAADSKTLKEAEASAVAQRKYHEAVTKSTEGKEKRAEDTHTHEKIKLIAEIGSINESTKGLKLSNEETQSLMNLKPVELQERINSLRAQTGAYTADTKAKLALLPGDVQKQALDYKYTEEQINKLTQDWTHKEELRKGELENQRLTNEYTQARIDEINKELDDVSEEGYEKAVEKSLSDLLEEHKKLHEQYTAFGDQSPEFWGKRAKSVLNMASSLGASRYQAEGGGVEIIPKAVENPRALRHINQSIGELYDAFTEAFDKASIPDAVNMLETANRLWDSTLGKVDPSLRGSYVLPEELQSLEMRMAVMTVALNQLSPKPQHKLPEAELDWLMQVIQEQGVPGGYLGTEDITRLRPVRR